MKYKNRVITIAVFLGVFFAVSVVFGAAMTQEGRMELKEDRAELREEIKEDRAELKEDRVEMREDQKEAREQIRKKKCELTENKIRTRVGRYENKKEQHKRVFDKVVSRVETLIEKFDASGLDVSQLEADLKVFEGMIADLHTEHDALIAELKETQEEACGESEGEFRKQLGEARRMVPGVRAELIEARDYYQTVIRVDILELREQIADALEDDQEESEESDQDDSQE